MKCISRAYIRPFIAILLLTVMYGKSMAFVVYQTVSFHVLKSSPGEDIPVEDNEGDATKDNTLKGCKKSWTEMEPCLSVLPSDPSSPDRVSTLPLTNCSLDQSYYQKVPTPPPLDQSL